MTARLHLICRDGDREILAIDLETTDRWALETVLRHAADRCAEYAEDRQHEEYEAKEIKP